LHTERHLHKHVITQSNEVAFDCTPAQRMHAAYTYTTMQSNEAKAAFERGGGGKRAEATRLLAAAKHSSGKQSSGAKAAAGVSNDCVCAVYVCTLSLCVHARGGRRLF
jgi:hypothetical protein